jgi:hypothetical protein
MKFRRDRFPTIALGERFGFALQRAFAGDAGTFTPYLKVNRLGCVIYSGRARMESSGVQGLPNGLAS